MNAADFGKRVAALRKEKGLTQAKLAEQIHVSNKTISRWETGEGYPEISLLKPLAKALGITVDELLGEETDADLQEDASGSKIGRFWKELTIFNKITLICLIICLLIPVYTLIMMLFVKEGENMLAAGLIMYPIVICSAGMLISAVGLILALLGTYKKQITTSVILTAICFAGRSFFPILISMVMRLAYQIG